ncbi:hypothetical protein [Afipia felis]|uniref:Uncharacterized protein n=2 Tax=Afipia felis TaxID=1035 RepID=A0A380W3K7_AFIFE|nr:hypothetical protein [Afipia felis]EKS30756.1 hypothetical protein HMPREF9697_03284 [Afipia felis ATCC 53690]SUU75501.1 Uncharacterised protein [Afipia felis]SUU83568.1 Uncharacterised protein [Afipia felis]
MFRSSSLRGVFLAMAAMSPLPAVAMELTPPQADLYTSVSINPPSKSEMTVCYGFVCRRRAILAFSDADRRTLTQILSAGKASAAAERVALQRAVVWFDRRVGPMIGTTKRVAKADIRAGSDATNFDCFDTTRDTTSLLLVLQEWNLLKFHKVGNPRYRGNPFALQTPHNTAVVVDKASGVEWVVDLWPKNYAEAPDVMPVEQWLKED